MRASVRTRPNEGVGFHIHSHSFTFIQVPMDHIGIVLEQLGDCLPCNETENGRWVVTTRFSSILAFNFSREGRSERTLDRAEKANQTDELRESIVGRSEDPRCLG